MKDPIQLADIKNGILYTFGESTIEVDGVIVDSSDDLPEDHPFKRVGKDKNTDD